MMLSPKKKTAFSLFELSIVLLIISLIIFGSLQGGKIIAKSRLVAAQQTTQNSAIEKIDGLYAWFETSLPESFDNISLEDGTLISTWHDRAIDNSEKNNALQTQADNQPEFTNYAINETLPALKFSGDQFMQIAETSFNNSSYTVFVVEKRDSEISNLFFISSEIFYMGYNTQTAFVANHSSAEVNNTVPTYTSTRSTTRMHSLIVKNNGEIIYYLNGGDTPDASNSDTTSIGSRSSRIVIGANFNYDPGNYRGYIAEVILFNRNLLTQERKEIEYYLAKKYNLNIS